MGLCKCPHRKVTNIFCFEHRVNVCEHCLMQNHSSCVVDTYRNWITDSVYSSKCGLCSEELVSGDTIRLLCLHIVHWNCLDAWARSLAPTTAPAGYTCPICKKMCVFPTQNQVSPIADELRRQMTTVNWARAGLGLSLLDNDLPPAPVKSTFNTNGNIPVTTNEGRNGVNGSFGDFEGDLDKRSDISGSERSFGFDVGYRNSGGITNTNHVNPMASPTSTFQNMNMHPQYQYQGANAQDNRGQPSSFVTQSHSYTKLSDSYGSPQSQPYFPDPSVTTTRKTVKFDSEIPLLADEEDKYRRRSPFDALSRWLRQMSPVNKRRSRRRTMLYVMGTFTGMIILLMLIFGRSASSDLDDDTFNLHANPHVLVGEGKAPLSQDFE